MRFQSKNKLVGSLWAPIGILLLALAIQLFQLGARTFHGDEFGSIAEALALGRNANGIAYFVLLHFWEMLGAQEFWLRLPSAFFGTASVALIYILGKQLLDRSGGLIAALLLATAPFAIAYFQQLRFYSFFLFASLLVFARLTSYLRATTRRNLLFLLAANVLLIGAHFFGILVWGIELFVCLMVTTRLSRRVKIIIGVGLVSLLALVAFSPLNQLVYYLMSVWTNPYGSSSYTGSRGFGLTNLAKLLAYYFFTGLGEAVYPLTWWLVPLGAVVLIVSLGLGIAATIRQRNTLLILLATSLLVMPALVFLVLDPLSASSLQGAAPRYLIFLLPIFYLVVAAGVQGRWSRWLLVPLLLVNAGGLYEYWYGNWSYSDDLVNWREVTAQVAAEVGKDATTETLVLVDGRAQASAKYYFPKDWHTDSAWNYGADGQVKIDPNIKRVILISSTTGAEERARNTALMAELAQNMTRTAGWGHFPLFLYVWERRDAQSKQGGAALELPAELYGLEFQDLPLPVLLGGGTEPLESSAAMGLPTLTGETSRKVNLPLPRKAKQVQLYSTLTGAEPPAVTVVARLVVHGADGSVQAIPLRAGYETAAWDGECEAGACAPAATWHKRLALVGAQRYEGSWRDFEAKIWEATIPLKPTDVSAVELERVTKDGTLYVWGLELE